MMMKFCKNLIAISALCLLWVCPVHAQETKKSNIAAGEALAKKLCARCHSITSQGDSPFKKAPPFRTLASKYPIENLEEALAEGIDVGHKAMPHFKFEPAQISNLLDYIASISAK